MDFICEDCGSSFARSFLLNRHIESVHGNISFNCNVCDYSANQRGNLMRHVESKHEAKMCGKCDFSTTVSLELTNHVKSHASLVCNECEKEFSTRDKLNRHQKVHFKRPRMDDPPPSSFKRPRMDDPPPSSFKRPRIDDPPPSTSKRPVLDEPDVDLTECFKGKVYTKSYRIRGKNDPLKVLSDYKQRIKEWVKYRLEKGPVSL